MHIGRARKDPDWACFHEESQRKVDSLWANKTWELVILPPGKTVTPTQMLCERKRGATGILER